jgi:N-acetylneuraminic acid mutarotase
MSAETATCERRRKVPPRGQRGRTLTQMCEAVVSVQGPHTPIVSPMSVSRAGALFPIELYYVARAREYIVPMSGDDGGRRVRARTGEITLSGGASQSPELVQMWRDGRLTDIVLTVEGGASFPAHIIVLAAGSEYVRDMLEGTSRDSGAPVLIPFVSATSLGLVLEWLYTGTCAPHDEDDLLSLARAANCLLIPPLQAAAEAELASRVTLDSCRVTWRSALSHNLHELARAAKALALEFNVDEHVGDELRELDLEQLRALIEDENLLAETEDAIFDFVMRWADAQTPRPSDDQLYPILRLLRFPHMARKFVRERVAPLPFFNSPEGLRLLRDGLLAEHEKRRGCGPYELYAIGGSSSTYGAASKSVDRFDVATERWIPGPCLIDACSGGHAAARHGNKVYAITDRGVAQVMHDGSGTWTAIASMSVVRYDPATAAAAGRIFAIGGTSPSDERVRRDLECYDPARNSWTLLPSLMSTTRMSACAATLRGEIYVVGGLDDTVEVLDSMEKYNPQNGTWTTLPSMPTARYDAAAAVLGGKLYVTGGSTFGDAAIRTVEVYDPLTGVWTTGSPMLVGRNGHGMVAVGGQLYVSGGLTRDGDLDTAELAAETCGKIERYDPEYDMWVVLRLDTSEEIQMAEPRWRENFVFV